MRWYQEYQEYSKALEENRRRRHTTSPMTIVTIENWRKYQVEDKEV